MLPDDIVGGKFNGVTALTYTGEEHYFVRVDISRQFYDRSAVFHRREGLR